MTNEANSKKRDLIDEAQRLVKRLIEFKHLLRENEAEFVMSVDEKLKTYGYGTFLSDKQLNWLRILDKAHVPDERQGNLFEGEGESE